MLSFSKSIWIKIFFIKKSGILNLKKKITSNKIYDRKSLVPLCFNGLSLFIHKGVNYRKINIFRANVGYKFGEYAYTRKLYYYPLKKKRR